mmetsp:Transcript_23166/g.56352  ORF Transcript_23166/g.56352 Transcript_23166/m.56352 type:complete len:92 (+) Transcript_23166:75-350(+)
MKAMMILLQLVVAAAFSSGTELFDSFARRLEAEPELGNLGSAAGKYQVFLWVSVAMILTALSAVGALMSMTSTRDPLLYAKFRPSTDAGRR